MCDGVFYFYDCQAAFSFLYINACFITSEERRMGGWQIGKMLEQEADKMGSTLRGTLSSTQPSFAS